MAGVDLNDVAVFVRVIERAGFARAARELKVPTSTVSRAVMRLESALGTQLVHRNTRSVTPTSDGQTFFREVAPAVQALHQAARGVDGADESPRGKLRVSAPNDIGSTFVAGLITAFVARYPTVDVDVELSMRNVNLVEEGFDVALRAADKLSDSSLVARKVTDLEAALYASPGYVEAHGMPDAPEGLQAHVCVLFRPKDGEATWPLHGPDGVVVQHVRGRISGDDFTFVRGAALSGGGVALIPRLVAADDVAAGRLLRILPAYSVRGASLHIVYAAARKTPAKIAAFRDFVLETCTQAPLGAVPPGKVKPKGGVPLVQRDATTRASSRPKKQRARSSDV